MITCLLAVSVLGGKSQAQDLLSNVYGRDYQLLNGKWGAIVDLYDQGERMQVYKNRKPQDNKQFYEYSFDGGLVLNVPADFNSQMPELKFMKEQYGTDALSIPQRLTANVCFSISVR